MRQCLAIGLLVAVLAAGCGGSVAEPTILPTGGVGAEPTIEATEPAPVVEVPSVAIPAKFAELTKRNWQKVVKTPDKYIGKGYQVWACITQFDAATGEESFRGDASYHKLKYWYEGDNAFFVGDPSRLADFVQDDVVVMNVVGLGSINYDTQIGGSTTVPLFQVVKITRKGSCG